jgi:hypothetical protein
MLNPKFTMRQNLTFLLFLYSLYGAAQLYVQQGTTLHLGSSDAILSSMEHVNQIDAPIEGTGTLVLNSLSEQQLTSTKAVLELPRLQLKNAQTVNLQTALFIKDQLILDRGVLHLTHTLILTDPTALVVGDSAGIHTSTDHFVQFHNTQLNNPIHLLAGTPSQLLCVEPVPVEPLSFVMLENTERSQFGTRSQTDYDSHFQSIKPPPKLV